MRPLIADTIGGWSFDGSTLRLEFPVSRLDALKPGDAASGRAGPVCRLVLTTAAAVELIRASGQITNALMQAGVLRHAQAQEGGDGNETPAGKPS
jgi:hypothetical protein